MSRLALMFVLLVAARCVHAGEAASDDGWIQQSLDLMAKARDGDIELGIDTTPDVAPSDAHAEVIEDLRDISAEILSQAQPGLPVVTSAPPAEPKGRTWYLFVSQAMPPETLRQAFAVAGHDRRVVLVFRGFLPGQRAGDFMRALGELIVDRAAPPAIQIDPVRFTRSKVGAAPTLVLVDGDDDIARATGIVDPEWAEARLVDGARGDLGSRGPVHEIAELDLLEVMRQRLARYDLERAKARAVEHYLDQLAIIELPPAAQARTRHLDPTIETTQDILDADGRVLVAAGTRVNPLDIVPMRQKVVVFDATDPRQVELAKREREPVLQRTVTFIVTQFPRGEGLQGLERVGTELGTALTVLTADVRDRFQLERVPSVIEADGNRFRIRELSVTDDEERAP